MVLQEVAQRSERRQQLESRLHEIMSRETAHFRQYNALVKKHDAMSREVSTMQQQQQHARARQQLSAIEQNNQQLTDELKVGLRGLLPEWVASVVS